MRGGKNERKRLYRQTPISPKLSGCTLCPSGGAALRRQAASSRRVSHPWVRSCCSDWRSPSLSGKSRGVLTGHLSVACLLVTVKFWGLGLHPSWVCPGTPTTFKGQCLHPNGQGFSQSAGVTETGQYLSVSI